MIWFLLVAGVLTVVVLIALLAPMLRQRRPGSDDEEPVAALFRAQLVAVDEEAAQGRLTPEEAEVARTEITRRLLAAADSATPDVDRPARRSADMSWRFGAAVAIAGLLPATAMAIYFSIGTPAALDRGAGANAADPHSAAELTTAVDQLKTHLEKAPADLKGWTLLGRTLASLGRFDEARDAYNRAIALAPDNAALHAEFGEALVLAGQGVVTAAAEAEFAKAPDDPRSRYYLAEAALQRGDTAGATQKLRALLATAPADAPWRQTVADRLAEISQNGAAPAGSTPGPTAQDVAAAQSMTAQQRQSMIRGMVERLAQRLQQHPDDRTGWERLARAYDVLGEPDKAAAARERAATVPGTAALQPEAPPKAPPTSAPTQERPVAGSPAGAAAVPTDAPGWVERARRLEGQGRATEALATLKQANAAFPGNLGLLEVYLNALAATLKDGKPTPEVAAVAAQINALDGNQPDALWYLGLAAAANGDRYRATTYWSRLLAELPASDPQRALVRHQLDDLR
jgi:cytochrome c-type biogenesis protein CcmH